MQYRVIFQGKLSEGTSQEMACARLATLFKTDQSKFTHWFSGKTIVIKKDLPEEQAQKYCSTLTKAGVIAFAEAQATDIAPDWSIDAVGSDMIRPEELDVIDPVEVDTSALRALDNSELDLTPEAAPPVPTPDTSHLLVMPEGEIENLPDTRPKISPDTSKLSLLD